MQFYNHQTRRSQAVLGIKRLSTLPNMQRRRDADKVEAAADDFIQAVANISLGLIIADKHAAERTKRTGRYNAPAFISVFDRIGSPPSGLIPYKDRSGRVVVIWQDEPGSPVQWVYTRRAHALAGLTASERWAFIHAVSICPDTAFEARSAAQCAFAVAMQGMRDRDASIIIAPV
jgi:hypothetical protein